MPKFDHTRHNFLYMNMSYVNPVLLYLWFSLFNATATTELYTSAHTPALHDALPIFVEIHAWRLGLGLALEYDVWRAANDRGRLHEGLPLGSRCLDSLPHAIATAQGSDAIRLIDVLWLEHSTAMVAAAFEVEHWTSIYSGIEIGRAHV